MLIGSKAAFKRLLARWANSIGRKRRRRGPRRRLWAEVLEDRCLLAGIVSVVPDSAMQGTQDLQVTFTLDSNATPLLPPSQVAPSSAEIETIQGIALTRNDLTYAIVDTGQMDSYDDVGNLIDPFSGQAFYGQDGQHDGNQPSYTTSADGLTVNDNVTGLTWTQSPDLDGDGDIDTNDKFTWNDAQSYVDTLNAQNYGGYSDWRLPTIKELYSLIDFTGVTGMIEATATPYIDTDYFAFGYGDQAAGERIIDAQYWSGTEYVSTTIAGSHTVFGVNFADGRIKGYGTSNPMGREMTEYVRYVRGNTAYGVNDFEVGGDGTVTDTASGLMWARDDSGVGMDWEDALAWVQQMNDANYLGYNDWRLPNAKELQSIVDYTRSPDTTGSAAIDPVFNISTITDDGGDTDYPYFWTSTTHLDGPPQQLGNYAVYVAFGEAEGWMWSWFGGYQLQDVHGAGAQRSDPKSGDPGDYPYGHGPQGDVIRIDNYVRLLRNVGDEVQNNAPVLGPIGDQTVSGSQGSVQIMLSATDADDDPLTYEATGSLTDPIAELAYELDQQYGFYAANSDYYNYRGSGEKYFRGGVGNWYFILPNGEVHAWNRSLAGSPLLTTLDSSYHADLSLVVDAQLPSSRPIDASVATLTVAGNRLTIDPADGFTGSFSATVTVSDGTNRKSETFTVSVTNTAPELDLRDAEIPHTQDALRIDLPAIDADGDPLTYTAELSTVDPLEQSAYELDQELGLYGPARWENYRGHGEKYLRGNGRQWYIILPNGDFHRWNRISVASSLLLATFDASYYADPSKLYDAPQPSGNSNAVGSTVEIVRIEDRIELVVDPGDGFVGDLQVKVTVTDGIQPVDDTFTLSVINHAPEDDFADRQYPLQLDGIDPRLVDDLFRSANGIRRKKSPVWFF